MHTHIKACVTLILHSITTKAQGNQVIISCAATSDPMWTSLGVIILLDC